MKKHIVIINTVKFLVLIFSTIFFGSCHKMVAVDPPVTSNNTANVYTNDATAAAVLTGIYAKISNLNYDLTNNNFTSISLFAGLSADEISLFNLSNANLLPYYKNDLTSVTGSGNFWSSIYPLVFIANSAIEGFNASSSLTPAVKQQLLGEAKFFRAFSYFYLTNLYGSVPLVTSTDYKQSVADGRSSRADIYKQIISDLTDAQNLLSSNYLQSDAMTAYSSSATAARVRPTKWAALALLARVYLFTGDYAKSEAAASSVIGNTSVFGLVSLNKVFKMNSLETIWSLQPVRTGTQANTGEGALFILPAAGPNISTYPVYLSTSVVNSFETNDQRKITWTRSVVSGNTYYYPYKYQVGAVNTATTEYIMVLRLAEQYLIRAEARANGAGSGLIGAIADVDTIRVRAGLPIYSGPSNKDSVVAAILHERQVELFTEWGHRWLDLQRLNVIDPVMNAAAPLKGASWSNYKSLYPIPQSEINLDPNLGQNTGYN